MKAKLAAATAVLSVMVFAQQRPAQADPLTAMPAAPPVSFAASRILAGHGPRLSHAQRVAIRAVYAASTAADRPRLIVSFPHGVGPGIRDTMVLLYGDPNHPDGVVPTGGTTANHVIGGPCNLYYRPSDGTEFPVPGCGAGCATWRDSRADLVARRYGLGG